MEKNVNLVTGIFFIDSEKSTDMIKKQKEDLNFLENRLEELKFKDLNLQNPEKKNKKELIKENKQLKKMVEELRRELKDYKIKEKINRLVRDLSTI